MKSIDLSSAYNSLTNFEYEMTGNGNYVNQWLAIHSRVHLLWHIQHQSKLHLVHSICIQPPSRSVGLLHLGQGLVITLIYIIYIRTVSSLLLFNFGTFNSFLAGQTQTVHKPILTSSAMQTTGATDQLISKCPFG